MALSYLTLLQCLWDVLPVHAARDINAISAIFCHIYKCSWGWLIKASASPKVPKHSSTSTQQEFFGLNAFPINVDVQ